MSHRWACLLGHPVAHSHSPALHNAAFQALGIDAHYEARDVAPEDVGAAVNALRQEDCYGGNVTAPHKQAAMPFVDELSDEVVALGALNTIVNANGRLLAANTDARGFGRWMAEVGIDAHDASVLLLGAGGAARAVVWAMAQAGARDIRVLNRTPERAEQLVAALLPHVGQSQLSYGELHEASHAEHVWDIVVNATSLGHHGEAPAVDGQCYGPRSVAIELAYNPPETGFMSHARTAGARAENGLGMLLHQAALAFERWTGQTPPIDVLEAALKSRVTA